MELRNKIAVITGGGTGMGKATAALFAREGATVIIAGRREQPLRATVEEINDQGGAAEMIVTDITEQAQVERLFDKTAAKHGGIDILFNCAGIFATGKMAHEFTAAQWEEMFRVNFWATLACCKQVIPFMQQRGQGAIINCSSVGGRLAFKNQAPYNASKAAVEMLSRCMAKELGASKIRVNILCPDLTDTDMAIGHLKTYGREAIEAGFPLGRMGKPTDIAEAALFFASDRSAHISGTSLFIDGGKHAY